MHLTPTIVTHIQKNGGIFLIGVKENQKELLQEIEFIARTQSFVAGFSTIDSERGRVDKRTYQAYSMNNPYLDDRWQEANFRTVIKVDRKRYNRKNELISSETAYYISNNELYQTQADNELLNAVRLHWSIETNNHIRDVTLKEDKLKTKCPYLSKNISLCRSYVVNVMTQMKQKNIRAKLEEFADNFETLISWLKKINFL